jgi:putative heme iron utilization protein
MEKPILKTIVDHSENHPRIMDELFGSAIISACKEKIKCFENPDLENIRATAGAILFLLDEIDFHTKELNTKSVIFRTEFNKELEDDIDMHRRYIQSSKDNLTKILTNVL